MAARRLLAYFAYGYTLMSQHWRCSRDEPPSNDAIVLPLAHRLVWWVVWFHGLVLYVVQLATLCNYKITRLGYAHCFRGPGVGPLSHRVVNTPLCCRLYQPRVTRYQQTDADGNHLYVVLSE